MQKLKVVKTQSASTSRISKKTGAKTNPAIYSSTIVKRLNTTNLLRLRETLKRKADATPFLSTIVAKRRLTKEVAGNNRTLIDARSRLARNFERIKKQGLSEVVIFELKHLLPNKISSNNQNLLGSNKML
jgi:hypothetical protein